MRERDIKWICNAKVERVDTDMMHVIEVDHEGREKKRHSTKSMCSKRLVSTN